MRNITWANLPRALAKEFPELREAYINELFGYGETPPRHVIYGELLNPYLTKLITARDEPNLRRVFAFLERLARHADARIREVVMLEPLDLLLTQADWLRQVQPLMGEATVALLHERAAEREALYRWARSTGEPNTWLVDC